MVKEKKNPFMKFRKIFKPLREFGLRYSHWERIDNFFILYFENEKNPYLANKITLNLWLKDFDDCMSDECIMQKVKEEVDTLIEKLKEAISDSIYFSYMDRVGIDNLEP